jgi:hypothetical protein
MTFKPEHFPRIEDKLTLFCLHVERGQTPPQWLMEYMAAGARECLIGGKPWQKGKGGGPKSDFGKRELEAYILSFIGGLGSVEIAKIQDGPGAGEGQRAKIERRVKRGKRAYSIMLAGQIASLLDLHDELLAFDYTNIPVQMKRDCRSQIKGEMARLKSLDEEPHYG